MRLCFLCSGTFAVISIMVGSVTEKLAPDSNFIANGTNGTASVNIDERDAYRVQIACSLTVLAGIFQVCVFVFVCVSIFVKLKAFSECIKVLSNNFYSYFLLLTNCLSR